MYRAVQLLEDKVFEKSTLAQSDGGGCIDRGVEYPVIIVGDEEIPLDPVEVEYQEYEVIQIEPVELERMEYPTPITIVVK